MYYYELEGSKIVRITHTDASNNFNELIPIYDSGDSPVGIIYNNVSYWYIKNLQGDVVAIRDENDNDVVRYAYDSWGKVTVNRDTSGFNLAYRNPFFYRGYFYDYDTKLYYLNSRYYDPELGRFLNADNPVLLGKNNMALDCNLYSYANNNPVNNVDYSGKIAITASAVFALLTEVIICYGPQISAMLVALGIVSVLDDIPIGFSDTVITGSPGVAIPKVEAPTVKKSRSQTIEEADTKIKETVLLRSQRNRYWTATVHADYVDIGHPIDRETAIQELRRGRDVFTVTRWEAEDIARCASSYSRKLSPVGPEIDDGKTNTKGFYWHYHMYNRRTPGHVFYLFGKI